MPLKGIYCLHFPLACNRNVPIVLTAQVHVIFEKEHSLHIGAPLAPVAIRVSTMPPGYPTRTFTELTQETRRLPLLQLVCSPSLVYFVFGLADGVEVPAWAAKWQC